MLQLLQAQPDARVAAVAGLTRARQHLQHLSHALVASAVSESRSRGEHKPLLRLRRDVRAGPTRVAASRRPRQATSAEVGPQAGHQLADRSTSSLLRRLRAAARQPPRPRLQSRREHDAVALVSFRQRQRDGRDDDRGQPPRPPSAGRRGRS